MRRLSRLLLAGLLGSLVALVVRLAIPAPVAKVERPVEVVKEDAKEAVSGPSAGSSERVGGEPIPHPTGTVWRGGRLLVQMSDGTRRYVDRANPLASDAVEQVTPSRVVLDGRPMYIRPAPRRDSARGVSSVVKADGAQEGGGAEMHGRSEATQAPARLAEPMKPGTFEPSIDLGRRS